MRFRWMFFCLLAALGCALAPPGDPSLDDDAGSMRAKDAGAPDRDGGAPRDAGGAHDAAPTFDGGASIDGGTTRDGGATRDAGPPIDGGAVQDGGADVGVPPDLLDAGVTNVPNASVIVYARIPETMQCGRSTNALVRVQNIGTRTWKNVAEDLGHKLGRLEPHEPLFLRDNLRFYMGWRAEVPPGSAYTFGFTLTAPREVGAYRLRLQMLEELVEWFGTIVERDIEVLGDDCAPAEEALTCNAGPATVGRDVEQAIDWLIGTSPHIFDFDINLGGGAYALRDEIAFTYGVTERLNALGLTAVVDGWAGDEIQVKRDRTFSDTFDIVRAGDERSPGGYVRRGSGAFRGTCHPAAF